MNPDVVTLIMWSPAIAIALWLAYWALRAVVAILRLLSPLLACIVVMGIIVLAVMSDNGVLPDRLTDQRLAPAMADAINQHIWRDNPPEQKPLTNKEIPE